VHPPAHVTPLQVNGAQSTVLTAGQPPAPLQPAGRVAVPPLHEAARQIFDAPGKEQDVRVVPSHAPPQTVPSVAQAARPPVGVPVTGEHVPALPDTLHASHWPLQLPSQQTPSTQNPEAHSLVAPHAVPFVLSVTQ
jgi:hypothetical protein